MSWKFWDLFKSETTVEEAIEHSVGYDLSPDAIVEETPALSRQPQPITAQSLSLDYTFVFPANTQGGMPTSRFGEPWEKPKADEKKKA